MSGNGYLTSYRGNASGSQSFQGGPQLAFLDTRTSIPPLEGDVRRGGPRGIRMVPDVGGPSYRIPPGYQDRRGFIRYPRANPLPDLPPDLGDGGEGGGDENINRYEGNRPDNSKKKPPLRDLIQDGYVVPTEPPQAGGIDWSGWTQNVCAFYPVGNHAEGETDYGWNSGNSCAGGTNGPILTPPWPPAPLALSSLSWPRNFVSHKIAYRPPGYTALGWWRYEQDFSMSSIGGINRPMPGTLPPTDWKYGYVEVLNPPDEPDADAERRGRNDGDAKADQGYEVRDLPGYDSWASPDNWLWDFPGSWRWYPPSISVPGEWPQVRQPVVPVTRPNPYQPPVFRPDLGEPGDVVNPQPGNPKAPITLPVIAPGIRLVLRGRNPLKVINARRPSRPRRRTREIKMRSRVAFFVWRLANVVTETCDFVEGMWDALPKSAKTVTDDVRKQNAAIAKQGGFNPAYRRKKPTCDRQGRDVANWLSGNPSGEDFRKWMSNALANVAKDQVSDYVQGRASKGARDVSRDRGSPIGIETGPAL